MSKWTPFGEALSLLERVYEHNVAENILVNDEAYSVITDIAAFLESYPHTEHHSGDPRK